jgi:hypothetical protein
VGCSCNPNTMGWNCECNNKATSRLQPLTVPINTYGALARSVPPPSLLTPASAAAARRLPPPNVGLPRPVPEPAGVAAGQGRPGVPERVQLCHRQHVRDGQPGLARVQGRQVRRQAQVSCLRAGRRRQNAVQEADLCLPADTTPSAPRLCSPSSVCPAC